MVDTRSAAPREMDLTRPAAARIYDAFLGGSHNFGIDRDIVERIERELPGIAESYRESRAFLRRAIEFMLAHDIRQFLDLGSGTPSIGPVHEIARRRTRDFRVVYVDNEPLTVAHSKPLLASEPNATIIQADLRKPDTILNHPDTRALLDFSRPVGLLIVGVLLFIGPQDRPGQFIASYRDRLVSGSYLAISQASDDDLPPDLREEIDRIMELYQHSSEQLTLRSYDEIAAWFAGTELVAPGLVPYPDWRPDQTLTSGQRTCRYGYVGVGRIP